MPVADILAYPPSLPLVIDYDYEDRYITAEEDGRMIPALRQCDRVHRVRLRMPSLVMEKLIMAIDDGYPVLEYLILKSSEEHDTLASVLHNALEAPRLRHLLTGVDPPMESRSLTTAMGIVTEPSVYFQPNILLECLSFMTKLETLPITGLFPITWRGNVLDVHDHLVKEGSCCKELDDRRAHIGGATRTAGTHIFWE